MKKGHILLLLIISTYPAFAQNNPLNQLFVQGDYEECLKQSRVILDKDLENATAYFFKGASLVRLQNYKDAETPLQKAKEYGYQPMIAVNVNLLRVYAGQKQTDTFLKLLNNLANGGFSAQAFLNNKMFSYLSDNEDYRKIKNKILKNAYPCKYDERHKKLDFWVGEWDVFMNDTKLANSKITKDKSGCTVHEDYRTLRGFYGSSINYFDSADSLFTQIWIDQRNNLTNYKEVGSKEGYLQMQADQGGGSLARMTWQYNADDDSVLQVAEASSDSGKTWSPTFTGLYRRKNANNIKDELSAVLDNMEKLFEENKMAEIAQYYTQDAQMLEPGGGVHSGNPAIKAYWNSLKNQGISWELEIIEAEELKNHAYSVAISKLKYRSGDKENLAKTKALIIWEKTDKGYRIKKDFFHFLR